MWAPSSQALVSVSWSVTIVVRRILAKLSKCFVCILFPISIMSHNLIIHYIYHIQTTGLVCSQVGDTRPLTCCRFSPDGEMLATSSLSGMCRVWSVPSCEAQLNLRGHQSGACSIAWHPKARIQPNLQVALASSAQVVIFIYLIVILVIYIFFSITLYFPEAICLIR